ncbi:MAG: DUF72 domain-containing protein [Bdellovibrionales bacterium]|nr:DUF72 domain-containing protein [Bdellovibrionales bacterium]
MTEQKELFAKPSPFDEERAKSIPHLIRFGTSTWTYEGWKGQVYQKHYRSDQDFKRNSLSEYASHAWFRTVGIDSFFYNPPKQEVLSSYAAQVPETFQWVSKVWEHLTIPKFPTHARYGTQKGQLNSDFLNAKLFEEAVLYKYRSPKIFEHTGPFVLQFPHIAPSVMSPDEFIERLHSFLQSLPRDFRYATEVRNKEYLQSSYFEALNQSKATHCFNHWSYMPCLKDQMKAAASAGGLSADFFVARILTPLGTSYQEAVDRFQPYRNLQCPLPDMRADVLTLTKRALQTNRTAFVIINNRAEGNAPLTIEAIGTALGKSLEQDRR